MGRMIPDIDPETIENRGEREFYRLIKEQAPHDWVIRYHFPACWLDGNRLRECECDFVILVPRKGLLLVEVKGSHGYHSEGGKWYRVKKDGSRESTRSPFDQATSTKHRLVERIARKKFGVKKSGFPGIYGHLVAYPFGRATGALPASVEPDLILAYADMKDLEQCISRAFGLWGNQDRGAQFTPDVMKAVEEFLADEGGLVPVLASEVDDEEAQIEELTRRQFTAFKGILGNARVHVTGTAGSGKTILALWAAEALASKGNKVLLVCFNRHLASWLEGRAAESSGVVVRSFFSFCRETVIRTGARFVVPQEEDDQHRFWCEKAPSLFTDALEEITDLSQKFDAVLVDEAQDFHSDWWIPLQLLLRDPDKGRLTLFSDPEQAGVYGRGDAYPDGLLSYELLENCRNTKRITKFCGRVIDTEIISFSNSPEGKFPQVHTEHADTGHRGKAIQTLLKKLLAEGFSPDRIAVLSPWKSSSPESAISRIAKVDGIPLSGGESALKKWVAGKVIWCSTIKAFKGLEADCVVIADLPAVSDDEHFSAADFYVASSRSKHRLYLFPASEQSRTQIESLIDSVTPTGGTSAP